MTTPPTDKGKAKQPDKDRIESLIEGEEKLSSIIEKDHEQVRENSEGIDRLASTFETSARRWELIIYPSLFAFIILASYGFYLVYSLSHDIANMTRSITQLTENVDKNMDIMAGKITIMSANVNSMTGYVSTMSDSVEHMAVKMNNLDTMRITMEQMNVATQSMAHSADSMQNSMGAMNYNIGRPMSQMNSFMPW
jgi:hypothetical protein